MKKYSLTEDNIKKNLGDYAVLFNVVGENLVIYAKTTIQRDLKGNVSLVPKIFYNEEVKTPSLINVFDAQNAGIKTFEVYVDAGFSIKIMRGLRKC